MRLRIIGHPNVKFSSTMFPNVFNYEIHTYIHMFGFVNLMSNSLVICKYVLRAWCGEKFATFFAPSAKNALHYFIRMIDAQARLGHLKFSIYYLLGGGFRIEANISSEQGTLEIYRRISLFVMARGKVCVCVFANPQYITLYLRKNA